MFGVTAAPTATLKDITMNARPAIDHHVSALDRLDPVGGNCTVAGCVHHPAPMSADRGK